MRHLTGISDHQICILLPTSFVCEPLKTWYGTIFRRAEIPHVCCVNELGNGASVILNLWQHGLCKCLASHAVFDEAILGAFIAVLLFPLGFGLGPPNLFFLFRERDVLMASVAEPI